MHVPEVRTLRRDSYSQSPSQSKERDSSVTRAHHGAMPYLTGNRLLLRVAIHGILLAHVLTRRALVSAFWRYRVSLQRRNAVNKSSALTMNRFPSRCALVFVGCYLRRDRAKVDSLADFSYRGAARFNLLSGAGTRFNRSNSPRLIL